MSILRAASVSLCALLATAACGDDGGAATDAATADAQGPDAAPGIDAAPMVDAMPCASDLTPTNDGTGIAVDLVLSEINPGDYIELYNNTAQPIALANVAHQLCSPFDYRALSVLAPNVVIAPGGFAQIPWPSTFEDVDAGGEVILYSDAAFNLDTHIVDFVCWGTNPHGSRLNQAGNVSKWTGACPGPLTGGAIHRVMSTTGTDAASYDVASAPSPTTCE